MSDGLRVDMLPAGHGDALWVEWGEGEDVHRMLIDGGTRATFDHLRERFAGLPAGGRNVDLLVISHIDLDHIDGAIKLLRAPALDIRFADIWFNDFHHLPGAGPAAASANGGPSRGGVQGEFLAAVLDDHRLPWNMAFDRGAVVVPETGPLPEVALAGGLNLVLLSPLPANLERLRDKWSHEVADANLNPGDRARALELLEERLGPAGASRGERLTYGGDGSEANGSSIAFVAEYGQQRWLFAADAHEDVLRAGLQRYAATRGGLPVRLEGFKLPHHGSVKNISPELLDMVDAATYLISTNGAYFHHPDAACIDLIVEKARPKRPQLVFNYRSDFTSKWSRATFLYDAARGESAAAADATSSGPERAPSPAVSPTTTAVSVEAVHGSLDRSDYPVLVGHYTATSLDGAEGHIDRRFGGRLSSRHALGEYPDEIGTHLYVQAPVRAHPSNGVIVVGLGEYGSLTPRLLATTVRTALVAHALDQADAAPPGRRSGRGRDHDRPLELGISTVALGATGDHGLSIRTSVRAILDGLLAANDSLRQGGRPRAQYTHIDFWERRAREAELTLLALVGRPGTHVADQAGEDTALDPDALPPGVAVTPDLKVAEGHLSESLPADEERRPWQRIRVGAPAGGEPGSFLELTFSADGGLAAIGEQSHRVERRRLDRLLAGSGEVAGSEDGLHTTLFELLLPNDLKWDLRAARDIQLEVDDTTADIPWEMLAARNTGTEAREPLALRASFIRQLRTDPPTNIVRAGRPRALVIGNPPAGQGWPTLTGAYEEAMAVVTTLELAGLRNLVSDEYCYPPDRDTDEATTRSIEDALFAHEYRIIHIAGHGILDPDDDARTGVVIGPDAFITAQTIGQLRPVPDLVFLNCCHLAHGGGLSGGEHSRLGASLARRLIRSGVRAVIAAGWAVDDAAATAFASIFYEQMTRRDATFGEAVRAARLAAHLASPDTTTWGAYQCYGDSGLRLYVNRSAPPPLPPVTPREVLRRVELVVGRFDSMIGAEDSEYDMEYIRQELAALTATARQRGWFANADGGLLAEALGSAHADIGNFETAIEWYQDALAHPGGRASLRSLEQLANLRDRLAARLARTSGSTRADRERAAELAADARRDFELLTELGRTSERTSLLAGHHKRQAVALTGKPRATALRRAADHYRKAVAEADPAERHYPLFNFIQLEEIRSRLGGGSSRVTATNLRDARSAIRRLDRTAASVQSFWNAAGRGDGRLAEAIADDAMPARLTRLTEVYLDAFNRRSTARQRSSVLEHLADLAELHPVPEQAVALAALRARLDLSGPAGGAAEPSAPRTSKARRTPRRARISRATPTTRTTRTTRSTRRRPSA
jgi:hypothetical protein